MCAWSHACLCVYVMSVGYDRMPYGEVAVAEDRIVTIQWTTKQTIVKTDACMRTYSNLIFFCLYLCIYASIHTWRHIDTEILARTGRGDRQADKRTHTTGMNTYSLHSLPPERWIVGKKPCANLFPFLPINEWGDGRSRSSSNREHRVFLPYFRLLSPFLLAFRHFQVTSVTFRDVCVKIEIF